MFRHSTYIITNTFNIMKKIFLSTLVITILSFTSCSEADDNNLTTSNLTLNIDGLENLGTDYKYEGWIIVNDLPVSTGIFSVDDSGTLSQTSFTVDGEKLEAATKFILSIEPINDTDTTPATTKVLGGDFSGNLALINTDNVIITEESPLNTLGASSGKYALATPTDGANSNERSGIWFILNSAASLILPELSNGWKYEGWVVMNGIPVSTGTFTDPAKADDNAVTSIFKGDLGIGPAFPGEDFIQNAPNGLTFPTDLRNTKIVISVEPSPDNSIKPFILKPLMHDVPADAVDHEILTMETGSVKEITGTVTRQ